MPTPKSIKKRIRLNGIQTEMRRLTRRCKRTRNSGRSFEDIRKENHR